MSYLLELLGKGLQAPLMALVLPHSEPLTREEIKFFSEMGEQDPAFRANQIRLAVHYAQTGAVEQTETVLDELLGIDPDHIEARLTRAAMYAATGDLDKSLQDLNEIHKDHPEDARILYSLGHCHERRGDTDQALYFYHEGCRCKPYIKGMALRIGAIYTAQRDFTRLLLQMDAICSEHPEDIWNYLVMGQTLMLLGKYQKAEEYFERALTIEPDNFEMQDDNIEELAREGRIPEAIESMKELIAQQGDFPDSYVRLADLYSQIGEDEAAVNYYQRALDGHPGYLEAAVKFGTQHLRQGRHYQAAQLFNQAIEINDQLIGAYVGLGMAQQYLGKTDQADETFNLAAALEPNTNLLFTEVNRLQVKIAQQQKQQTDPLGLDNMDTAPNQDKQEALKQHLRRYEQKLSAHPNQANLNYNFALLLRNNGQIEAAVKYLKQALQINPAFFKARIKAGLSLRELGCRDESIIHLQQAFQVEKEYVNLHYQLGLMYCDKLKFALAVERFEETLDEETLKDSDVEANLTLALENMNLVDRAAATWRFICELEPQSPMAFQAQRSVTVQKHPML